jgi:hypothetical protein
MISSLCPTGEIGTQGGDGAEKPRRILLDGRDLAGDLSAILATDTNRMLEPGGSQLLTFNS